MYTIKKRAQTIRTTQTAFDKFYGIRGAPQKHGLRIIKKISLRPNPDATKPYIYPWNYKNPHAPEGETPPWKSQPSHRSSRSCLVERETKKLILIHLAGKNLISISAAPLSSTRVISPTNYYSYCHKNHIISPKQNLNQFFCCSHHAKTNTDLFVHRPIIASL